MMIRKPAIMLRITLGLGASLGAVLVATHPMHAAAPSPAIPAARALLAATSYRQFSAIHMSTAGSTAISSVTLTLDVVRRGTSVRTYIQENVSGTVIQLVQTGRHACERSPKISPTWSCGPVKTNNKEYQSLAYAEKSMGGTTISYVMTGTQTRQGQLCNRYTATLSSPSQGTGRLVFWFAVDGGHPVEQDGVFTRGTSTTIWSHWNDPGLTIPAVPAS